MVEQKVQKFDTRTYAQELKAKPNAIALTMSIDGNFIEAIQISYPGKVFKFEERSEKIGRYQAGQVTHFVTISEQEYIKGIAYKQKQDFIASVEFQIANLFNKDQYRAERIGTSDENEESAITIVSQQGYQLAGMRCTRTTFLQSIEGREELLAQYQPVALVSNLGKNQERFINNYHAIKTLQNIIPAGALLDDSSEYKKYFIDLNLEIEEIIATKNNISDDLQDVSSTLEEIMMKYNEVKQRIASALSSSAAKFSLKKFKDEYRALERFAGALESILLKFGKHEQSIKNLRLKDPHKRLKMMMTSSDDIKYIMQSVNTDAGVAGVIELELEKLQESRLSKEALQLASARCVKWLEEEITNLEAMILTTDQMIAAIQQKQVAGKQLLSSTAIDDLAKFSKEGSDIQSLKQLQSEFQAQLTKITESFERRKELIKDQIQKEVDKIQSSKNGPSESASPLKKMHIIIIADESGSMSGSWSSVRSTVDNFVLHFASTDNEAHLFSVITFDNSCRYHAKREKASNVQKLPDLACGGTRYGEAIEMGAEFVSTLTPLSYSPIIVFMTDGVPGDSLGRSLAALKQCSQKTNFLFFAVGFGSGYDKNLLTQLSNAGNNNKQGFTLGSQQIKFVYDAIDDDALQQVFDTFTQNFDFAAQENAIAGLEKQLEREVKEFQSQMSLYNKVHEQKVESMKNQFQLMSQFKDLSVSEREDSYVKLLEKQVNQSTAERQTHSDKMKSLQASKATQAATDSKLTQQLQLNKRLIETTQARHLQASIDNSTVANKRQLALQKLKLEAGFTDQDQIAKFQYQLSYIEGILSSQMIVIKDTRNVARILKHKIDDLCLMMKPSKQKSQQKQIDTAQMEQGLKAKYSFLENNTSSLKQQLLEVLKIRDSGAYEKYIQYLDAILDNVDILVISQADDRELKSVSKKLAKEMLPSGKESDSESNSDSGSKSKSDDSEEEEDVSAFLNSNIDKGQLPQSQSEIKQEISKAKSIKKQLKRQPKSDERSVMLQKVDASVKYLKSLQDKKRFQQNVYICLKKIRDITSEVFGQQLKKDFFDSFKITFNSFGDDILHLLIGIKDSSQLLTLEGLPDLKIAIDENKYASAKPITSGQSSTLSKAPLALE